MTPTAPRLDEKPDTDPGRLTTSITALAWHRHAHGPVRTELETSDGMVWVALGPTRFRPGLTGKPQRASAG